MVLVAGRHRRSSWVYAGPKAARKQYDRRDHSRGREQANVVSEDGCGTCPKYRPGDRAYCRKRELAGRTDAAVPGRNCGWSPSAGDEPEAGQCQVPSATELLELKLPTLQPLLHAVAPNEAMPESTGQPVGGEVANKRANGHDDSDLPQRHSQRGRGGPCRECRGLGWAHGNGHQDKEQRQNAPRP